MPQEISKVCFADAYEIDENGQIGVLTGLLSGDITEGSLFHSLL